MIPIAMNLKQKINTQTGMFNNIDDETSLNILFHIISKGYHFYMMVIDDASIALYLIDQYQPLYTMMRKKLKIIG
jgi:hypothetical protein